MSHSLTFDAVREDAAGAKWQARWQRSWPAYEAWLLARGGDDGPSRAACEAALETHMPELVGVHARLTALAGGSDRAARFLSHWHPPSYLGGCTLAAVAQGEDVRLVRNYDLSPDLNEGLLLRSCWTGRPVMGMVEFLWGLSDGINDDGLAIALAHGGSSRTAKGFGVTLILRYVLETCRDVPSALAALRRVPSHMAYNVTLADRHGRTCAVELIPGGGARLIGRAMATNHQHGEKPEQPGFTKTFERHRALRALLDEGTSPEALTSAFLAPPFHQTDYAAGFGTLFTASYHPRERAMALRWPDAIWRQRLDAFEEGSRAIVFGRRGAAGAAVMDDAAWNDWRDGRKDAGQADGARQDGRHGVAALAAMRPWLTRGQKARFDAWAKTPDWAAFGQVFAGCG